MNQAEPKTLVDSSRRSRFLAAAFGIAVGCLPDAALASDVSAAMAPYPNFETGPVRPLLVDDDHLYVLNTPDHRVEVFRILDPTRVPSSTGGAAGGLSGSGGAGQAGSTTIPAGRSTDVAARLDHVRDIFTGLEPTGMFKHPSVDLLYVSNHVSDTVSVIDTTLGQVIATLPVGDEPQGMTIAGGRLFVACARASQTPLAPGQTDPGPLVDHVVQAFEALPPFAFVGQTAIDAWKPRDLVAIGPTVYVIPQNSGNHTIILDENHTKALGLEQLVPDAFDGGPFPHNPVLTIPALNPLGFARGWYVPNAGRIVFDWEHPGAVAQLRDHDILAIDAASLAVRPEVTHGVGTTLYDIERNPITGDLWVAATEANNRLRFEPRLRGTAVENRVTIATPGRPVNDVVELAAPRLDDDYAVPVALAFLDAPNIQRAYVAAQSSARIAVLDPTTAAQVDRIDTGLIPAGLATDAERGLLFVLCRGDKSIRVYDAHRGHREVSRVALPYDPEPASVTLGRRHLYEARDDGGHGEGSMSCASCHVFGHSDGMGWDLGDPEGSLSYYYPDILQGIGSYPDQLVVAPSTPMVHPLKGPMVTQSLRGLMSRDEKDDLTLHWRGERRTFHTFDAAFRSLLGGDGVTRRDVQEYATFVRSIRYAPNPFQPKDRVYTGDALAGAGVYGMTPQFQGKSYKSVGGPGCIDCHNGDFFDGSDFTGSRAVASAGSFTQLFQTAQLRMLYEKDYRDLAGFGALHDGAVDGVRGFMDFTIPQSAVPTFGLFSDDEKDQISAFTHAWDHGIAPLVGAQFTLTQATLPQVDAFLDLAEAHAQSPLDDVDLILKGFRYAADGTILRRGAHFRLDPTSGVFAYQFDTGDVVGRDVVKFVAQTGLGVFTFTCVPRGTGARLGVDRDEDGVFDFVEAEAGLDPTSADTDGDGYTDGRELALGSDPLEPDAQLADAAPPAILDAMVMEVSHDLATLSFFTDEPASVTVEVGTANGLVDVGVFPGEPGLRQTHDVILDGLPAGQTLHYRIVARDRNDNAGTSDGTLLTNAAVLPRRRPDPRRRRSRALHRGGHRHRRGRYRSPGGRPVGHRLLLRRPRRPAVPGAGRDRRQRGRDPQPWAIYAGRTDHDRLLPRVPRVTVPDESLLRGSRG